jgi:hypothetical protein
MINYWIPYVYMNVTVGISSDLEPRPTGIASTSRRSPTRLLSLTEYFADIL